MLGYITILIMQKIWESNDLGLLVLFQITVMLFWNGESTAIFYGPSERTVRVGDLTIAARTAWFGPLQAGNCCSAKIDKDL